MPQVWTTRTSILRLSGELTQDFKHQQACVRGQTFGHRQIQRPINTIQLVSKASEIMITIENIDCKALLDTGSTVSTINEEFYRKYLNHLELHSITDILNVECADGNS